MRPKHASSSLYSLGLMVKFPGVGHSCRYGPVHVGLDELVPAEPAQWSWSSELFRTTGAWV